jgi:hypothetical protein
VQFYELCCLYSTWTLKAPPFGGHLYEPLTLFAEKLGPASSAGKGPHPTAVSAWQGPESSIDATRRGADGEGAGENSSRARLPSAGRQNPRRRTTIAWVAAYFAVQEEIVRRQIPSSLVLVVQRMHNR